MDLDNLTYEELGALVHEASERRKRMEQSGVLTEIRFFCPNDYRLIIAAIKTVRELTGASLREAKESVERGKIVLSSKKLVIELAERLEQIGIKMASLF